MNDDFDRLMDAHQTLIQLRPGDVLTQEMIDDLLLVESDYRHNDERNTDAFHKGYQVGLERASSADTAKLIEDRDEARAEAQLLRALARIEAGTGETTQLARSEGREPDKAPKPVTPLSNTPERES